MISKILIDPIPSIKRFLASLEREISE